MIVILKPGADSIKQRQLIDWFESQGCTVEISQGRLQNVLGIGGNTSSIDSELVASLDIVDSVKLLREPFERSSRRNRPDDAVISVGNVNIGGGGFTVIAGPCSVESEEQIVEIARSVKASGAQILRGGAFKPRTSPYDFQGLKAEGLKLLKTARAKTGMPIVSELMGVREIELFEDVDIIQVGARSMQNYDLLTELGKLNKPVLLKRGLSSTLRELLMSAEYIMAGGNLQVILCERGIRTFDDFSRNTLDLAAVPMLRELSCLPVIVDPSHATGLSRLVPPMALAAAACGADGVMIEVHNDPIHALSDGAQSLRTGEFDALARKMRSVRRAIEE